MKSRRERKRIRNNVFFILVFLCWGWNLPQGRCYGIPHKLTVPSQWERGKIGTIQGEEGLSEGQGRVKLDQEFAVADAKEDQCFA